MPYCPKCRYEYERRVTVCPDCQTALVEELPAESAESPRPDDSTLVVVVESQDYVRIQFLVDLLEQNGIFHVKRKVDPFVGSFASEVLDRTPKVVFTGGVERVYVDPADVEKAKELWDSLEGEELSEDEVIDEEQK